MAFPTFLALCLFFIQPAFAEEGCSSPIPGQSCMTSNAGGEISAEGFNTFLGVLGAVIEGVAQGMAQSQGSWNTTNSNTPTNTYQNNPQPQQSYPQTQAVGNQSPGVYYTDSHGEHRCFQTLAEMRQYQVQENANAPKFVGVDVAARYREEQAEQQALEQQQAAQRQQQQQAQQPAQRASFTHNHRLAMDMGRQVYIVTINNTGNVKLACNTTVWGIEYGNFGNNRISRDYTDSQHSIVWPGTSATGGQWSIGGLSRYTVNCNKAT